jgi:dolichol kinase
MSLLRKLIHQAMALLPLAGWLVSFELELVLAFLIMGASLTLEWARRRWRTVNWLLWRTLPSVFREWETRLLLGSTWFAMGALASLVFFGRDAGGTAILCLAWGDAAAELAGHGWHHVQVRRGRLPAGGKGPRKTLAGSLGCLAACLVAGATGVILGGLSVWAAVAGAVVATAAERWSPPPDDNVWMPVLSGLAMWLVQLLI